jgi:hypothetical protein
VVLKCSLLVGQTISTLGGIAAVEKLLFTL